MKLKRISLLSATLPSLLLCEANDNDDWKLKSLCLLPVSFPLSRLLSLPCQSLPSAISFHVFYPNQRSQTFNLLSLSYRQPLLKPSSLQSFINPNPFSSFPRITREPSAILWFSFKYSSATSSLHHKHFFQQQTSHILLWSPHNNSECCSCSGSNNAIHPVYSSSCQPQLSSESS